MKKGLIFAFLFILMGIFYAGEVESKACEYAEFGDNGDPDYLQLKCGGADGLCPEDYGDWRSPNICDVAGYDPNRRCNTPDTDCGGIPAMYFDNFPTPKPPSADLIIKVHVTSGGPGKVQLYKDNIPDKAAVFDAALPPLEKDCASASCDVEFSVASCAADVNKCGNADPNWVNAMLRTPNTGGTSYGFVATLDGRNLIRDKGVTTPIVNIINSASCGNVQTEAYSEARVTKVEYRLERAGSKVEVQGNAGSCQICGDVDCNLFQTAVGNDLTFSSTGILNANCPAGMYDVIVTAYDNKKNSGSDRDTCNVALPPVGYAGKVLRLTLAKVKIWL